MVRKENTLEELRSTEANKGEYTNGARRLLDREEAFLRLNYKSQEGRTIRAIIK